MLVASFIVIVSDIGWTHESQRAPEESQMEALDWIANMRLKVLLSIRHKDYILNMDQTPLPFEYSQSSTLAVVGQRSVHKRKSTGDTRRATCTITICASGNVLLVQLPSGPLGIFFHPFWCSREHRMEEMEELQRKSSHPGLLT